MSIHSITLDEFMLLSPDHHRLAVRLFTGEINSQIKYLANNPTAEDHQQVSDELLQGMQLRKVHQGRLDELEQESNHAAPLVSEQYELNERHDLAA